MPTTCLATSLALLLAAEAGSPVAIGARRELLVDNYLLEAITGCELRLHQPIRRELVLRTDAAWEGNASAFQSVFQDGDLYRMYYRGLHYRHSGEPAQALEEHPWYLCYAESDDGLHWRRPEVGRFEFDGSNANNIVLTPEFLKQIGGDPAHTTTFLDTNPDCPPAQRIKCIVIGHKPLGMYVLGSADGTHFELLSDQPAVTEGAFDSQNLAFWDPVAECYREYHRGFKDGVRAIMTASSDTILKFPKPEWVQYEDSPHEHLYTNEIQPYYRAPHILMGFPMRYTERGWSDAVLALPDREERLIRAKSHPRYGYAVTDALFMTSRDGLTFKRWGEAFIRPGPRQHESWVYGDNFVFWGMVETASAVEDTPAELSLYATEGYWEGVGTAVRRYTLRIDGFVSAHAPLQAGELVTKPLTFEGGNLSINAETSGAGGVQVELQRPDGTPIPGYSLSGCPSIPCDSLNHVVRWDHGGDVRELAGQPIRIRFVLSDADLYSFQFVPYQPDPVRVEGLLPGLLPKKSENRGPFTVVEGGFTGPAGVGDTTDDLNPPPFNENDSGWLIREGSPDRVQLRCDDPPGSGTKGDLTYLKIHRGAEGHHDGGAAWLQLSPQDASDTTGSIVEVTARIYVPHGNRKAVDIDAYDSGVVEFNRRAFHLRIGPGGGVFYYKTVDVPVPELKCELDRWQEVVIRADSAAGTFDLTVGGKTVEGLPFAMEGVRRIRCLFVGPNSSETTLYLAGLTLRVEP